MYWFLISVRIFNVVLCKMSKVSQNPVSHVGNSITERKNKIASIQVGQAAAAWCSLTGKAGSPGRPSALPPFTPPFPGRHDKFNSARPVDVRNRIDGGICRCFGGEKRRRAPKRHRWSTCKQRGLVALPKSIRPVWLAWKRSLAPDKSLNPKGAVLTILSPLNFVLVTAHH